MEKVTKSFEYKPNLTAEEMAAASGLTVKQVRNRLQRQGYSHRQNKEKLNFEKVKEFFEKNPNATPTEASIATGLSRPSIYKFRAMGDTYVSTGTSIQSTPVCLSVADNLNKTLRGIISLHLETKTFECDLTFGEGGFYKNSLEVPKYIFDKFDFGEDGAVENVKELNGENLKDIMVSSVMIDLPIKIGESGVDMDSFKSVSDLYAAYDEYIKYAHEILNKNGILVFSTSDFILKEDNADHDIPEVWAADYAITVALSLGFDLKDKIHLVRKGGYIRIKDLSIKTGVKDSTFLIFIKRR